ncbi:hypothetical protein TNCT_576212 [Trichonephila clavata]|uniref:Uncharacterized protein n=1 Tax=Trichonephila clavata TaxID=2740835 RepID=A0A8X6H3Y0_TRICU|nr:hypothetical protein TNCT_576212 [Trichonephila clavata]
MGFNRSFEECITKVATLHRLKSLHTVSIATCRDVLSRLEKSLFLGSERETTLISEEDSCIYTKFLDEGSPGFSLGY